MRDFVPQERTVTCSTCEGAGVFRKPAVPNRPSRTVDCADCGGTGRVKPGSALEKSLAAAKPSNPVAKSNTRQIDQAVGWADGYSVRRL